MPSRPPVPAFRWNARLLAGLLLLFGQLAENGTAAQPAPAGGGAAGKLTHLGGYPGGGGNHTVSSLPDGRLLFYGVPLTTGLPTIGNALTTRNRQEVGAERHVLVEPRLWDPVGRGWRRVERPPGCPHNSFLATATSLPDGKVLIAGGLCDAPRLA